MLRCIIALAIIGAVCGTRLHISPQVAVNQAARMVAYARGAASSLPGLREQIAACSINPGSHACVNGDQQ